MANGKDLVDVDIDGKKNVLFFKLCLKFILRSNLFGLDFYEYGLLLTSTATLENGFGESW